MNENDNDSVKATEPETERQENEEECNVKRRTKEDRPRRKDDKKSTEQHLKILSHVSSTEEKVEVMCKKYSQVVDENRRLSLALKHSEKKVELLLREREQLQVERSKGIMTRKRLENLCRELQKQNKIVKNESLQRVKEQEEIRKDLSEKFQGGLAQITTLMNQNIEKNAKMYEENLEINKKFKAVYEQVEQKEQQLLKVHQQMKLDLQIADAKLAKVKMEATAEKETLLKEKQQLLLKMSEYQAQIKELQATEVGLRSEISMYTDKYDEFQNALNRSNKIYGEFNVEMEKMTKKMHVLEKETGLWKQRWANSHDALLAMAADKQVRDGEIATLSKKVALLQDLCKMFQSERAKLLAQLKTRDDKTLLSPESPVSALADSPDIIVGKHANELPDLETIEQLQVSLTDISEGTRKDSDAVSLQTANDTVANRQSEAINAELYEESAERSQTEVAEDAVGDSSEDCDRSSKSEGETKTKPISIRLDSVALNDATETQKVESNNEEESLVDASDSTITEIIREGVYEDKPTELLIKEVSEMTRELEEEIRLKFNLDNADDDEAEVKKRNNVDDEDFELRSELSRIRLAENMVKAIHDRFLHLTEEEKVDLSRRIDEEIESRTVENEENGDCRIYEDAASAAEEREENAEQFAHANSNVARTLSNDLARDDHPVAAAVERDNTETEIVETKAETDNESTTGSVSALVKNTPQISKTTDTTPAATEDASPTIDDASEVAAEETANEVIKNSSELVDSTIDVRLTEGVTSLEDATDQLAAESVTSALVTENVAASPSREEMSAEMTSESDRVEGKLRKSAKNGKRRKK